MLTRHSRDINQIYAGRTEVLSPGAKIDAKVLGCVTHSKECHPPPPRTICFTFDIMILFLAILLIFTAIKIIVIFQDGRLSSTAGHSLRHGCLTAPDRRQRLGNTKQRTMLDRVKLELTVVLCFLKCSGFRFEHVYTSKRQMHFNLERKLKPGTIEKNSSSTTGRPGEIKSMAARHHWATKQACITP